MSPSSHRLFLADGLLKSGLEADAVIAALDAGGGERRSGAESTKGASFEPLPVSGSGD